MNVFPEDGLKGILTVDEHPWEAFLQDERNLVDAVNGNIEARAGFNNDMRMMDGSTVTDQHMMRCGFLSGG